MSTKPVRVRQHFEFNAEGVGKFQPRVCFETLGKNASTKFFRNPERVASIWNGGKRRNLFKVDG
jgi:hypothetical protein